ncbi:MAG: energy-coupled thiamine transporter ThiT [Bacilli bacterium]|nr:energy-coupled thiamine transporter ThiT [Bacilli bacterium]
MDKSLFKFSVRDICEIAMMCALGIAIDSLFNFHIGENGGSISFSCVPLFIVSYRHGWFKGFIASGIVFGFITCVLDGWGLACYPFDYLIAFGSIGIAGLFGKKIYKYVGQDNVKSKLMALILILITVLIHGAIRFVSSTVSSVVIWHKSLIEGIAYQATYVPATCAVLVVFLYVLLPALSAVSKQYPTTYLQEEKQLEKEEKEQINE